MTGLAAGTITFYAGSIPYRGFRLFALVLGIDTVAAVIGGAFFYVGVVNGVAYLANPLRGARRHARSKLAVRPSEAFRMQDVSVRARKYRNTALLRFVVQIIGVGIAANGTQTYLHQYWYIYLVIGLAVV